jgi:hypothetical protein
MALGMVTVVVETAGDSQADVAPVLEQECQTWDWARTAGVSAQELRTALRESLEMGSVPF